MAWSAEVAAVGLTAPLRYQVESGGKRLRPALTLWFLEALGGSPRAGSNLAVAVELLHNYFLIHDDIEDEDHFRRDSRTLWSEFGVATALNLSDLLLAEAYRRLGLDARSDEERSALYALFTEAFRTTVEGQALDLAWRADVDLTLDRYEEIIQKKTSRYLAFSWVCAAHLADRPRSDHALLWNVGWHLGAAFQMCDDLIDLGRGKGRNQQVGNDIREGKPSFLVAYALGPGAIGGARRDRLIEILRRKRDRVTPDEVDEVVEMYKSVGALDACRSEARSRAERAVEEFGKLSGIAPGAAEQFRSIADFVTERGA